MKNLDEIIKKTLLNMNYDSKKTLFENRVLLREGTDKPLTFIAPNPKSPTTNIKILTIGKSLGTVASNLEKLKESKPLHNETTLILVLSTMDAQIRNPVLEFKKFIIENLGSSKCCFLQYFHFWKCRFSFS